VPRGAGSGRQCSTWSDKAGLFSVTGLADPDEEAAAEKDAGEDATGEGRDRCFVRLRWRPDGGMGWAACTGKSNTPNLMKVKRPAAPGEDSMQNEYKALEPLPRRLQLFIRSVPGVSRWGS
jgi:hypothetical protein